jgi:hypothetical protein
VKRYAKSIHVILTFFAVGACIYLLIRDRSRASQERVKERLSERFSWNGDFAVRQFLGVKWIGGDVELPEGHDHCGVAILKFENGKYKGWGYRTAFSLQPGQSRVIPCVYMWGPNHDGYRDFWFSNGMAMTSSGGKEESLKVLVGLTRRYGVMDTKDSNILGYHGIGSAHSQSENQPIHFKENESDYEFESKRYQYFIVMGVKLFASEEEAKKWQFGDDPNKP